MFINNEKKSNVRFKITYKKIHLVSVQLRRLVYAHLRVTLA